MIPRRRNYELNDGINVDSHDDLTFKFNVAGDIETVVLTFDRVVKARPRPKRTAHPQNGKQK